LGIRSKSIIKIKLLVNTDKPNSLLVYSPTLPRLRMFTVLDAMMFMIWGSSWYTF